MLLRLLGACSFAREPASFTHHTLTHSCPPACYTCTVQGLDSAWFTAQDMAKLLPPGGGEPLGAAARCQLSVSDPKKNGEILTDGLESGGIALLTGGGSMITAEAIAGITACPPSIFVYFGSDLALIHNFSMPVKPEVKFDLLPGTPLVGSVFLGLGLGLDVASNNISVTASLSVLGFEVGEAEVMVLPFHCDSGSADGGSVEVAQISNDDITAMQSDYCDVASNITAFTGSQCALVRFCNDVFSGSVGWSGTGFISNDTTLPADITGDVTMITPGDYPYLQEIVAANSLFPNLTAIQTTGFDPLAHGFVVPGPASAGIVVDTSGITDPATADAANFYLRQAASICWQLENCGFFDPASIIGPFMMCSEINTCLQIYNGDGYCDAACNSAEYNWDGVCCAALPLLACESRALAAVVHAPLSDGACTRMCARVLRT